MGCCFVWWFGIWLSCVDCGFGGVWLLSVLLVICALYGFLAFGLLTGCCLIWLLCLFRVCCLAVG